MPGYLYAWTQPSAADDEQICIVFNVVQRGLVLRERDSDDE